jgi:hypothetical protein
VALFTPTLERLVALIRGRMRFPDGFDGWHRDERQDFKRTRWVVHCCVLVGGRCALLGVWQRFQLGGVQSIRRCGGCVFAALCLKSACPARLIACLALPCPAGWPSGTP